jgi:hypothetical protein
MLLVEDGFRAYCAAASDPGGESQSPAVPSCAAADECLGLTPPSHCAGAGDSGTAKMDQALRHLQVVTG